MPTRTKRRPAAARNPSRAPASLGRYNAKRNLEVSGEPEGGREAPSAGAVRRFVIQKHDASRLHYDFRLEMDGVYRSWAVPKGLPMKAGDRSLAVEVEDHPLEYGNFEGVIPSGNYGAGTVMLWDRGHYTVSGVAPERAYKEGKMHIALVGENSVAEWTHDPMHPRPGDKATNWLIIKNNAPAHAAPITGDARELSVLSGRSLEQIASGEPAAAAKRAARRQPPGSRRTTVQTRSAAVSPTRDEQPKKRSSNAHGRTTGKAGGRSRAADELEPARFIAPMKALSVDEVPAGEWRLEIKLDGYRAIAVINDGEIELWSRNHKPLTADYPEVVAALKKLPCRNAVVDGEVVALDEHGHSRFQLLQNRDSTSRPAIVYYAFDLLHHDGRSLLATPIEERQMALEVLIGKGSEALRYSPVFEVPPEKLLEQVRKQGLEGIIAKTPGSVYEPDRRSGTWLKCKVHGEQEFVIGGFTPPKNSRAHFGALLVGYYENGQLQYAGKVGSGFNAARLAALHREFMKRRTDECPFANLPSPKRSRFGGGMTASMMKQVTWVKPELVAQVQFTEWTEEGSLRHPVFLGLREDKNARDVVRE
jgi:bifunctional non-homologous end joining protein LigD